MVFHYLEVLDALKLTQFDLVGSCVGGWIAAELAVRHPEKIRKLVLIGASGLFVQGALIGDIFMNAQPEYGSSYATLREMLFSSAEHPMALEMFPDGKGEIGRRSAPLSNAAPKLAHRFQAAVLLQPLTDKPVASHHVTDACHLGRKRQLRAALPRRDLREAEFPIAANYESSPAPATAPT